MESIHYNKGTLFKGKEVLRWFSDDIEKILVFDPYLFVLLGTEGNKVENRNLFCLTLDGDLVWQCEDMLAGVPADSIIPRYAHYVDIWMVGDELWGYNYYGGHNNRLDVHTGKILESHYVK